VANGTRSYPGWQVLLLLIILGGIIGGWIGDAIIKVWPNLAMMGKVQSIGVPNFSVNLKVCTFSFGFMMHLNLFAIIGFVLSYLVYKRL